MGRQTSKTISMSWRLVLAGLLCQSSSAFAQSAGEPLSADAIAKVVEEVEPSVVSILRIRQPMPQSSSEPVFEPQFPLEPDDQELLPNDFGAGLLVKALGSDDLFILTAYHVVRNGVEYQSETDWEPASGKSQLRVTFHHRRSCAAAIFASDPRSDLAVLAFDRKNLGGSADELKPIDWQTSPPVRKGEFVICMGNPYALARDGSASVSWGIVSNLARRPRLSARTELTEQLLSQLGTVMQIDSRLQLGGSGGPVVNLKGQLVGISTALAAIEGYEKSAGFAIPVAPPMRRVIQTLLQGQEVEYGLLGITPGTVDGTEMKRLGLYGKQPSAVLVRHVQPLSPAHHAGINVNDVLLRINEQPLYASGDLMRMVGEQPPETEIKIELFRPSRGREVTVHPKLGKWPVRDEEGLVVSRPKYPAWRGLRVDYTSGRKRFTDLEPVFLPGVIIVDVAAGSRAAQAQLQAGEVITHVQGTAVQTPAEFHRAVKDLRGEVVLRFHGGRGQTTIKD